MCATKRVKCKHRNGWLAEQVHAANVKDVNDGVVDQIGTNEIGEIMGYLYHCNDCGKEYRFTASPRARFLRRIYDQLSSE